jgi:hypothetical protein
MTYYLLEDYFNAESQSHTIYFALNQILNQNAIAKIKLKISIKLNIYLLYWYFQQTECLNIKKTCYAQHT